MTSKLLASVLLMVSSVSAADWVYKVFTPTRYVAGGSQICEAHSPAISLWGSEGSVGVTLRHGNLVARLGDPQTYTSRGIPRLVDPPTGSRRRSPASSLNAAYAALLPGAESYGYVFDLRYPADLNRTGQVRLACRDLWEIESNPDAMSREEFNRSPKNRIFSRTCEFPPSSSEWPSLLRTAALGAPTIWIDDRIVEFSYFEHGTHADGEEFLDVRGDEKITLQVDFEGMYEAVEWIQDTCP